MDFVMMPASDDKALKRSRRSVYLRLLQERKIFLCREVDARLAHQILAQLLFLEAEDPGREVTLYIHSPGGEVTSGLAIYDAVRAIKPAVVGVSAGLTASIATIILVGATRGKRLAFPNSKILIHQPLGGVRGQATDIEIHAREILKIKERINHILASHTGQPIKKVEKDTNRDYWMSADEAQDYGIVDAIIPSKEPLPPLATVSGAPAR